MINAVKIRVDDLKDRTVELSAEETVTNYPNLQAMEEAGECSFTAPLRVNLSILREYDHIRVSGRISTVLRLTCSRCLGDYSLGIDSPFTIFYMRSKETPMDEDVELSSEDLISVTYDGDEIDFTDEISEQIILAIPFKPLCREECRGLCSNCGTDLNSGECACSGKSVSFKFDALKEFKIKN